MALSAGLTLIDYHNSPEAFTRFKGAHISTVEEEFCFGERCSLS